MVFEDHVWTRGAPGAGLDAELPELQRLLDAEGSLPSGSWKLELPSHRAQWSPELHTIYGTDPQTFLPDATNIFELTHPHDRQRMAAMADAWRDDPAPFRVLGRIVRPTGEVRVIDIRGWVERDARGVAVGAQGTSTDVTEIARDRRERAALDEQRDVILRATGDAICGVDTNGQITFHNPALLELLGRTEREVDGVRLHDLVHQDAIGAELHPYSECPYAQPGTERTTDNDAEFRRADGSTIEVSFVRVAVSEDRFDGAVISIRDVTERRETTRRLSHSLQQVRSLSAQRERLLRNLVAAEENERARIAADLHDDTVQTLSAVSLRLEQGRIAAPDTQTARALARAEHDVRAATDRMRFLLFELLPPVSETDLNAAVEAYCQLLFSGTAFAYEVSGDPQDIPIDCYLLGYRIVQEALRNVLTRSPGSSVQVRLESDGVELVVHVCDDGAESDRSAAVLPAGDGVRIVRQRAQAAGGSVEVGAGSENRGALITVRLPLHRDARERVPRGGSAGEHHLPNEDFGRPTNLRPG